MLGDKLRAAAMISTTQGGLSLGTAGTYSFVVPSGVTSLAALAIGGGGGGGGASSAATVSAAGGGGGGLSYSNAIAVTPGETLTVVVGVGGAQGNSVGASATAGGDSYIRRSSTDLLLAKGGGAGGSTTGSGTGGGGSGGAAASGVGDVKYSGGLGGQRAANDRGGGGGGAAGYAGDGGAGGFSTTAATAGAGGGGGGGVYGYDGTNLTTRGGAGGGVQFYGQGGNGAAGIVTTTSADRNGGLGSSNGTTVKSQSFGGGGGGGSSDTIGRPGNAGGSGAVRILWGGGKQFPSTSVTSNTISLYASSNSDTSTITVPSGVIPGDLLVLFDVAFGSSSSPANVIPTGFTQMTNDSTVSGNNGRMTGSYKSVLDPADSGTTLTGMNGSVSNDKILLVIRGTSGFSSASFPAGTSADYLISLNAIAAKPVGLTGYDPYVAGVTVNLCAAYGSLGITPGTDITFSGATFVQGTSTRFWAGYKIYGQSDTTTTDDISMVDRGTNILGRQSVQGL